MFKESFLSAVLLVVGSTHLIDAAAKIEVRNDIKGRLLTPEEGCGGGTAKNGAWPWLARIGYMNGTFIDFICGGSLITSRHVLTASHCFVNNKFNIVRLGEYDTNTESDGKHIDLPIDSVTKHASYVPLLQVHDIALVKIKGDVSFTDHIRPICLPVSEPMKNFNLASSSPIIAGWGTFEENTGKKTSVLHEVRMSFVDAGRCKMKHQNARKYHENDDVRFNKMYVICAAFPEGSEDACQGDSGGPLMFSVNENGRSPVYQFGISSYGLGCAKTNIPVVHTNVRHYIDWILKQLQ